MTSSPGQERATPTALRRLLRPCCTLAGTHFRLQGAESKAPYLPPRSRSLRLAREREAGVWGNWMLPSANADAPTSLSNLLLFGLHDIGESTDEAPKRARASQFFRCRSDTPRSFFARESEKKREMANDVKRCRHCGQAKHSHEFRRNARCRDGLSSWCADCHVQATRAYRQRRREAEADAAWRRRKAETEELRRWEVERRVRVEQR